MRDISLDKRVLQKPEDGSGADATHGGREFTRGEWQKEVLEIFDKNTAHKAPYEHQTGKFNIIVVPNVFSPKYFTDSLWFAEKLPEIVGRGSLLEIGSGTGIISLYCADAGATVTASDINPDACRNTQLNAERFDLPISVRNGDLFEKIRPDEKYDFIFWNHPFNKATESVGSMLLRAGFDEQYEGFQRYVEEGPAHLAENGQLLLGTGSIADIDELKAIARMHARAMTLLESTDLPVEEGSDVLTSYYIYRIDKVVK